MNREELFEWLNTCPTHKWDIIQDEVEYLKILIPYEDEKKEIN